MPHDKNGKLLKEGDEVLLRCRVTAVHEGETACNITAQATERPEGETYIPTIAGNSRFYELVEAPQSESTPSDVHERVDA